MFMDLNDKLDIVDDIYNEHRAKAYDLELTKTFDYDVFIEISLANKLYQGTSINLADFNQQTLYTLSVSYYKTRDKN